MGLVNKGRARLLVRLQTYGLCERCTLSTCSAVLALPVLCVHLAFTAIFLLLTPRKPFPLSDSVSTHEQALIWATWKGLPKLATTLIDGGAGTLCLCCDVCCDKSGMRASLISIVWTDTLMRTSSDAIRRLISMWTASSRESRVLLHWTAGQHVDSTRAVSVEVPGYFASC